MIIYFLRHGKAEVFGDDFSRELTTQGKIELNNKYKEFSKSLPKDKKIKIYSSPLKRACQSAEILSEILKTDFTINEEVLNYNIRDFIEGFERDKINIIISHEPFISTWIRDFCKVDVIVSRGSIHKIEVDKNLQGKLLGLY